jgi:hypothetical protein
MPFRVSDGGVKVGSLGFGLEILIPPRSFPGAFLAFFRWLGVRGAFRLLAQVLETLALDLVEGSSEGSALGS